MTTIPKRVPFPVGSTKPAPSSTDLALAAALSRFLATSAAPSYLRVAGASWLAQHAASK